MRGKYLGEFEELVLLIVASLGENAYAVSVKDEIVSQANRRVNISAVHTALYRLEDKGFLTSKFGGASGQRGGKNKRLFTVTSAGYAVLQKSKSLKERLWKNIPQLSFNRINL